MKTHCSMGNASAVAPSNGAMADKLARWDGTTMTAKKPVRGRKNRNIGFRLLFDCNPLLSKCFRQKWKTAILRIIRNFLRVGVWGEGGKC